MSGGIDDPTSSFNINLLSRDDLLDLVQKQCSLIDVLQLEQTDYQEKMDLFLKDELLNQVYETYVFDVQLYWLVTYENHFSF
jgi:hypothetical protein